MSTAAPFSHEAFFYRDLDGFLDSTVPFVREGLAAGEVVLAATDPEKGAALRDAVPEANGSLHLADMAVLGANPSRIISAWADFVQDSTAAGRGMRGIGEPIWPGRTADAIVECQRHEALLNLAFAKAQGFRLVCPYDEANLDEAVLAEVTRSHPLMFRQGSVTPSASYEGAVAPFEGALPEPETTVDMLAIEPSTLREIRHLVAAHAAAVGLDEDRSTDAVLAVTEAATNTLRHTDGTGTLRIWSTDDRLLCEVIDTGLIEDPLAGRLPPLPSATGGRGLWLVNQLCDLVQIRSSESGTAVRMQFIV